MTCKSTSSHQCNSPSVSCTVCIEKGMHFPAFFDRPCMWLSYVWELFPVSQGRGHHRSWSSSFKEFAMPRSEDVLSLPLPHQHGTAFLTVHVLHHRWTLFRTHRKTELFQRSFKAWLVDVPWPGSNFTHVITLMNIYWLTYLLCLDVKCNQTWYNCAVERRQHAALL